MTVAKQPASSNVGALLSSKVPFGRVFPCKIYNLFIIKIANGMVHTTSGEKIWYDIDSPMRTGIA